jgi:hypothetical protein
MPYAVKTHERARVKTPASVGPAAVLRSAVRAILIHDRTWGSSQPEGSKRAVAGLAIGCLDDVETSFPWILEIQRGLSDLFEAWNKLQRAPSAWIRPWQRERRWTLCII